MSIIRYDRICATAVPATPSITAEPTGFHPGMDAGSDVNAEDGTKKSIRIYLKYTPGNVPVISRIERVSRPGCRVYVGSKEVPRVLGGLGINILTTPRGVMTGSTARKEGVGGEVLCHVW